ncbi:MAG: metal-sensitive transcriptional regulator [Thermodesulfobacteriota bacterium]
MTPEPLVNSAGPSHTAACTSINQRESMYPTDELIKQMQGNIQSRLKKIEGQIRGLQGMIAADKDCEQILMQAQAAQSALKAVCSLILKVYLFKCYGEPGQEPASEEALRRLDQAIDVLSKFFDR